MEVFIGIIIFGAILVIMSDIISSKNPQKHKTKELDIDPNDPYAELNISYNKKIQEANTNRLEELKNERLKKEEAKEEAKEKQKEEERERIKQEKERLKKTTYTVSLNPIKWAKYTLIITSAEKKFVDIYNFQTPQENKNEKYITNLAITVLFEEARQNKLSPNDFKELLAGLGGKDIFYKLIKPFGNDFFDFESFTSMYFQYIDFRAREYRPIIAMIGAMSVLENNTIDFNELNVLAKEYEKTPMFGRSV